MKEIHLSINYLNMESLKSTTPVYVLESNYDYTKKYNKFNKSIYIASVMIIVFTDRITLFPITNQGNKIIQMLNKIYHLNSEKYLPSALNLTINQDNSIREYLEPLNKILNLFSADLDYGLYGFFSYELCNIKIQKPLDDEPLGFFYLPEIISCKAGEVKKYRLSSDSEIKDIQDIDDLNILYNTNRYLNGLSPSYDDMYKIAQENIAAGFINALNPSFSITHPTNKNPYTLFKELLSRNCAPYNIFMSCPKFALIGASPAMFLRVKDGIVETSPICGTVMRGKSEDEDRNNINTLLASKKDDHELSICVKNNLIEKQIICDDVRVLVPKEIEKFLNVFHTSAYIVGKLKQNLTSFDVISQLIWPSTVVGFPLYAAANLISSYEKRYWYAGAFGYISIDGNANFGSIIRSAVISEGKLTTRVGSTITKFSSPTMESSELLAKASLILGLL